MGAGDAQERDSFDRALKGNTTRARSTGKLSRSATLSTILDVFSLRQ